MKELQTGSEQWRSNKEREESNYRRSQKIKALSAEETEADEQDGPERSSETNHANENWKQEKREEGGKG